MVHCICPVAFRPQVDTVPKTDVATAPETKTTNATEIKSTSSASASSTTSDDVKSNLTLYVGKFCPFSLRCQIALHVKKLKYKEILITKLGKEAPPDFLAIQPSGVVPVLVDDGKVIPESWDILKHLESHSPQLIPNEQVATKFQQVAELQKAFAGLLTMKNPAMVPKVAEAFTNELKSWDAAIVGPYFFGENLTVVDLGVWSILCRLPAVEFYKKYKIPAELGKIQAWLNTMRQHPSTIPFQYNEKDFISSVERMARPGPIALMNAQHAALRKHAAELETTHDQAETTAQRAAWITSLRSLLRHHNIHGYLEDTVLFNILKELKADVVDHVATFQTQHHALHTSESLLDDEIKAWEIVVDTNKHPVTFVDGEEQITPRFHFGDVASVWTQLGDKVKVFRQDSHKHMEAEEAVLPPIILPVPWEKQSEYVQTIFGSLTSDQMNTFIPWLIQYQPDVAAQQFIAKSIKFVYAEKQPEVYQHYVTLIKSAASPESLAALQPIL